VLDVDDADTEALEALARLYGRAERWRDLADLTRRRAEQSVIAEEQARFRMQLAKLLLQRLDEPTAAIDELQAVVDLVPPDPRDKGGAVASLEGLLPSADHKARVIDILRPVYERWDAWSKLVSLNEERLAIATDAGERIAILRENAALWEDRGRDSDKAFDAMRAAWILDPEDGHAREELDRFAVATARWEDLASAYETAIAKTEGLTRKELLASVARLHDQRRDDPRRALDAWERLFAFDETDLDPLAEMENLATLLSDWPRLVRILTRKAELLADDEARASTWRRIGEAKRDMLDDGNGAIEAYERALEIEPDSAITMDRLLDLYGQRKGVARLAELYERRIALCGDDESGLRFDLLLQASSYYEEDLGQRREAIEYLAQALLIRPDEPQVLRRLDALYTQERMWPELLDNLQAQVRLSGDPAQGRGLRKRIAALHAVELNDPHAAFEAYRAVLESGFDEEAVSAVRSLGETQDDLRSDVADTLEPVLRAAGRSTEVASVLELRLRAQTASEDRAKTLRQIASVAEVELGDIDRAQSALIRAVAEEPQDPDLHLQIERIATRVGAAGWQRYAEALQERAGAIFDAVAAADLLMRLGRVAEDKLDDPRKAADAYLAALERMGDDGAVLSALDRLFTRLGESRRLGEILERRVSLEGQASVQAELLFRLGRLQIDGFGARSHGLATLRQALEREPGHGAALESLRSLLDDDKLFDDAFDALSFAYRALGRAEDVADLYERRVGRAHSVRERIDAQLELANVVEELSGDRKRAQKIVEAALSEDPSDANALGVVERLAQANDGWIEAADTLKAALEGAEDLSASARAELWVKLAEWRRDKLHDLGRAEDAYRRAVALDPENVEVLREIENIQRQAGRERDLVATLRTRARLEADMFAKRDLFRQAKGLADDALHDPGLAEEILRDLISEDDADEWGLEQLTELRSRAGDYEEVVRLLLRRAELVNDGAAAIALKREAASVCVDKLQQPQRAVGLYEEILDAAPDDAAAASALRSLYGQSGRSKELAKLLVRLVDVATNREQRTELRLELATLQAERFRANDDAIDTLRAILDEDPTQTQAVLAISRLYEQSGRDGDLADLLKNQVEASLAVHDAQGEMVLLARLAEVQENRLGDLPSAQENQERILQRDEQNVAALEAIVRIADRRSDWDRAAAAASKLLDLSVGAEGVSWALRCVELEGKRDDEVAAEQALLRGLKLDPANATLRAMLRQRWEKAQRWTELADLLVGDADLIAAAHPAGASVSPAPMASAVRGGSVPPPAAVPAFVADQVRLLKAAADILRSRRNSPEQAIPLIERASRLVPQDRDLLLALCDAYNAAHRDREAAQTLEKVIASFGTRRTKDLAVYHHRLGKALMQLGDKDAALAQFDQAFRIDPGSVSVLKDLGVLAFEGGDYERAQKTFRALLLQRLDANAGISKAEVFCYLGDVNERLGDRAKAAQMYERAVENDPNLERARQRLADLKK
jgi:Tfp pilus assembly protein PilF